MAPSTVVSFTLPITCVVEVLLFPYIGALTDYSPHRKNIWLTAFGLLMLTSMLIAVMWHNYVWVVALACMVLNGIFYDLQLFPIEAYLPEFSDPVKVNGYSQAVYATGGVTFVIIGGALSVVMPMALGNLYGTIVTAMIAVLFAGVWGIVWTIPAAMRIQSREATPLPEEWKGRNLFVVGFLRVFRTALEGFRKYPQVFKFWIYQALMLTWSDAIIFNSNSYFAQQLRMGQTEAILVVVCVLITIIPGTLFILWVNKWVRAKWLLLTVSIVAFLLTLVVSLAIWQPQQKLWTFPLMVMFGLTFGAYYTMRSGVYATIIPGGEEALYTAVGLWFGNLLRWVPGVTYGLIVDASPTQSHRWAFLHLGIYPIIAICIIVFIDFDKAEEDIVHTLKNRKSDNKARHSPSHNANVISPKSIVTVLEPKVSDSKANEASVRQPAHSIENDVGQHKHAQQHKQ